MEVAEEEGKFLVASESEDFATNSFQRSIIASDGSDDTFVPEKVNFDETKLLSSTVVSNSLKSPSGNASRIRYQK